jgi:hypothetical protein
VFDRPSGPERAGRTGRLTTPMDAPTFEWGHGKAAATFWGRVSRDSDGHSSPHRLLLVAFTDRQGRIRLIGARDVTRGGRRDYEENQRGRS